MNYPCPRELAYLSDGASSLPEESPAFSNAAGAYILECVVPCWELVVSRSARFGGNYEFRPGWGNQARIEAVRMSHATIRAALAAMGK
ncbi:hypothetical protein Defa_21220 [Desulfovibrio sp. TH_2024_36128]|uniref:Uncharacterized protein n=1 Tax=Desulfovibrio falkowii TaxID=3136602 RepID=A0ABQ0E9Z4_9BACT